MEEGGTGWGEGGRGFLLLSLRSIAKLSRAAREPSEVPIWATLWKWEVNSLSWKVIKPRE